MPTLTWIGKDKVVTHHKDVPYRVLTHKYGFNSAYPEDKSETHSGNKIIHGDNLEALKSLLPEYEGRIDVVYIDPPYNTGQENWVYNDNVNDPKIQKWLGDVVGKDGEDLSRHDKWLCMMYPRLTLIGRLLKNSGVIAISIGFHELNSLYYLCSEIFPTKQVVIITVLTSGGKPKDGFNYVQEYVVFVAPKGFSPNPSVDAMNEYSSPYHGMNLAGFNQVTRPNQVYPIYIEKSTGIVKGVGKSLQELIDDGSYTGEKIDFEFDYSAPEGQVVVYPVTNKGDKCVWRLTPESFMKDWKKGYIKIVPQSCKKNNNEFAVQYLADGIKQKIESGDLKSYRISDNEDIPTIEIDNFKTGGVNISTVWTNKSYYTTRGSNELSDIFGEKGVFPYPKPMRLIKDIIQRISTKDSIILDSFGGSGTTAHAVLSLNNEDGGNRQFILIEMLDYAEKITSNRVQRVMCGSANVEGLGGSFDFYELGERMFDDNGDLNENIDEDKIREYIFFTETKQHMSGVKSDAGYCMGDWNDTSYYFYYKRGSATTLSFDTLMKIVDHKAEQYIIYADICTISDADLAKRHIIFKKIPRDITRF